MRRWTRWLLISALACAALAVAAWVGVRKALHHQPSFYVRALSLAPEAVEAAGDELEKDLLSLHNQVRHEGSWHVAFAEAELNGWLAADLPNKFPKLLPKQVSNPRIALRDDELLIAFQNETKGGPMVVSVAVQISTTAYTNEVALRVKRARIGALPLPLSRLIQQVSNASRKSGVKLRWTEQGGDPVALLTIAPRHPEFPDHLSIAWELIDWFKGNASSG